MLQYIFIYLIESSISKTSNEKIVNEARKMQVITFVFKFHNKFSPSTWVMMNPASMIQNRNRWVLTRRSSAQNLLKKLRRSIKWNSQPRERDFIAQRYSVWRSRTKSFAAKRRETKEKRESAMELLSSEFVVCGMFTFAKRDFFASTRNLWKSGFERKARGSRERNEKCLIKDDSITWIGLVWTNLSRQSDAAEKCTAKKSEFSSWLESEDICAKMDHRKLLLVNDNCHEIERKKDGIPNVSRPTLVVHSVEREKQWTCSWILRFMQKISGMN